MVYLYPKMLFDQRNEVLIHTTIWMNLENINKRSESEVVQSCPTLCDPMDCSLPGSSVHGIFQARVLEWGAIYFSIKEVRHKNLQCMIPFI